MKCIYEITLCINIDSEQQELCIHVAAETELLLKLGTNVSKLCVCVCLPSAIEREFETSEGERVSADMRIRKSQVGESPSTTQHALVCV